MATQSDIAAKCGVSKATVSYVLSGRGDEKRISLPMQEQIINTAEAMGYFQNNFSLTSKPRIAVFWPQRNIETTLISVMNGINSAALLEPDSASIIMCPYESNCLRDQASLWSSKEYDSAMVVSANVDDLAALTQKRTKIPVVICNRNLPGYYSVSIDHEEAGRMAALHAISKGGDSVGVVVNPRSLEGMNLRCNSFINTCKRYGIDLNGKIFYCENSIDNGYELGISLIRENRLPKVITCIYDIVGFGMTRAFVEAGIQVGRDVQILATGTSLSSFFAKCTPPMTVVDLRLEEISQRSMRVALDIALHRIHQTTNVVLHPSMIYRASSPAPSLSEREEMERRTAALDY